MSRRIAGGLAWMAFILLVPGCAPDADRLAGNWRPVTTTAPSHPLAVEAAATARTLTLRPGGSAAIARPDGSDAREGTWREDEGGWVTVRAGDYRATFLAVSPGRLAVPVAPTVALVRERP